MLEVVFDQLPNVLGVGEIKSSVNLVQNVNRGGFEEEEGKDQSQGDKGSEKKGLAYFMCHPGPPAKVGTHVVGSNAWADLIMSA